MSVNSSSSHNASLPPPSSSSDSIYSFLQNCLSSTTGGFSMAAFTVASVLAVAPPSAYVVYLGLRRRPNMALSHFDIFTYNMIVSEMLSVFGAALISVASLAGVSLMMTAGIFVCTINLNVRTLLHLLTCVERYLAVVHPVTYLGLRRAKGGGVKNMALGLVWLSSAMSPLFLMGQGRSSAAALGVIMLVFTIGLVSFCSLSVLWVLIRLGPGEGGGARGRVDQSKLRAFYTMMAILGALLIMVGGNVLFTSLYNLPDLDEAEMCRLWLIIVWFYLPSSLIQPLLFLQRAGKLPCCEKTRVSN